MISLKTFANTKVLVLGDVMLDRYWWGTVSRISPEAPVPIVRLDRSTTAAGGAANVALNIAGLGATPVLIGAVGDDAEAAVLAAELSLKGVDSTTLLRITDRPTSVKTRIIAHSQQVVRVDSETSSPLNAEHESMALAAVASALSGVDGVVVSDYAKGFLTDVVLRNVIEECRRLGKMIFVDPKGKDYSKYSAATLLTPNKREAAEACNFDETLPDLVQRSGEKLMSDLALDDLLITEGEHGMTLFRSGSKPVHIETAAKQTYDVTGAGDTVIATLAVAACSGFDLVDAAKLANLAAGIVVEQVGTTAIMLEQLEGAASTVDSSS